MRYFLVVWVLGLGVGLATLSGCGTSTTERIAWYEARLAQTREVADAIDARLGPALERLAVLQEQLNEIEAQDPEHPLAVPLRRAVDETTRAVEAVQSQRAEVLAVIESAEASLEQLRAHGSRWADEMVAAGRLGEKLAPMSGPAAPWVYLGSSLLASVGGLFIRRPGDLSGQEARRREDTAWDEADGVAFDRGFRAGRAEGRLEGLAPRRAVSNPGSRSEN